MKFVTSKDVNSLLGDFRVEEPPEKDEQKETGKPLEHEQQKDDMASLFETAEAFTNLKRI